MNDAEKNINEMLELDEDKKASLLSDMLDSVLNKKYEQIIEFHNSNRLQKYLIEKNNIEDLSEYYLLT
jgi:hypothetical protein